MYLLPLNFANLTVGIKIGLMNITVFFVTNYILLLLKKNYDMPTKMSQKAIFLMLWSSDLVWYVG